VVFILQVGVNALGWRSLYKEVNRLSPFALVPREVEELTLALSRKLRIKEDRVRKALDELTREQVARIARNEAIAELARR